MDSLDAASGTNSGDNFGAIVDDVLLLDSSEKEESDSDSHRESSLEPGSAESSPPEPETESDGPEGVATSAATSATSRDTETESSQLPVAGPYDFGTLKASLLRGRLQDDDKYEALKHLDQPLQCKFPPVMEGKQLRRFQISWLSKYPWLTYSRSENGGYCAYCLAFASSVRSRGNLCSCAIPMVKF